MSRRAVLRLGVGATFAAVVVACSGDDDTTSTAARSTTAAPGGETGSTGAGATKTVDTIHGPVEVPTKPARVVCLGFVDTACMLDIGLAPIGMTTSGVNFLPEYEDTLASIPDVTDAASFEYKVELIASLKPDLIIGSDWLTADKQSVPYDQLSKIAPTAICEWQQAAGNWPEQAAWFADVVGRSDELDALKTAYESRADEIKAQRSDALATTKWALVQGGEGEWYFYTPNSSHGQVFARAGAQFADINTGEPGGFVSMSTERIGELAAANAIALNVNESAAAGAETLQAEPLFETLPAAADGSVYPMSWFFPSSYKVASALLEEIDAALAKRD